MTKTTTAHHTEWLSLIESAGVFFAVEVLERVFPQGLDAASETPKRQRLRAAYDEWRDAVDEADPQLEALHREWVRMVLDEGLEYDPNVLASRERMGERWAFTVAESGTRHGADFALLKNDDRAELLVNVYAPGVDLERAVPGATWTASPLERMTALCRATNVALGLVTNGERWMLVRAPAGGVSGYAAWYARLWWQEPLTFRAFTSLLGVRRAFGSAEDTLERILIDSLEHQEEVTNTLGEQVREAVEVLVQALDFADETRNRELLKKVESRELYEAGLSVMMRLVFVLCAEERGLLLLGEPIYDQHYAISTLRGQLEEDADRYGTEILERRQDAWSRLLTVFRAVYAGIEHENLRLAALGGSLFDPDRFPFLEGRANGTRWQDTPAAPLPIDNRTVLMLLKALQVLEQRGGARLLSYRSLDVEQIGHVYEGLLEYTVARVPTVTLGLQGSQQARNPNVSLVTLEDLRMDGGNELAAHLAETSKRSASAIRTALAKPVDDTTFAKLLRACGNQSALADRVKPFVHLLRTDNWGEPLVYRERAFAVTRGDDRRETGAHYTPKSLTEQIVKTTLEPIVYVGPAEGTPREEWRLKSPAELLELKICDPAMGSGAFLVQVCRWLAERLTESWTHAERDGQHISIDGETLEQPHDLEPMPTEPMPADPDERQLIARRLIAERCLYGVDINPLAVELAKLSIWLTTLAKGRPFGFLDHNLRSGDSLLGIHDLEQLTELNLKPRGKTAQNRLFAQSIREAVHEALELRRSLRDTTIRDIRDVERMAALDSEARHLLAASERVADALVGAALRTGGKAKKLEAELDIIAVLAGEYFQGDETKGDALVRRAREALSTDLPAGKPVRNPFHWVLEFPEVFERQNGGFDAFVGNPPYMGVRFIVPKYGEKYFIYLDYIRNFKSGAPDLCVFFLLVAEKLIRNSGNLGLLLTNTISETGNREVGLGPISTRANIYLAERNVKWPGKANISVAMVFIHKGVWLGKKFINNSLVSIISPGLDEMDFGAIYPLKIGQNARTDGFNLFGDGFILSQDEFNIFTINRNNLEIIYPYFTGDELAGFPSLINRRFAVDFDNLPIENAKKYKDVFEHIETTVKPIRNSQSKQIHQLDFWKYWDMRNRLRQAQKSLNFYILMPATSKYVFARIFSGKAIFNHSVKFLLEEDYSKFLILNSTIHDSWVRWTSGRTNAGSVAYSTSKSLATFAFPNKKVHQLEENGINYNKIRDHIMIMHDFGVTDFYNMIHNKNSVLLEILEFRKLIQKTDQAIIDAYGWSDIDLDHRFRIVEDRPENDNIRFTISEPARLEILRRLAALNRERYEQELEAGLHDKPGKGTSIPKTSRAKLSSNAPEDQTNFFDPAPTTPNLEHPTHSTILEYLQTNPGWHGKDTIITGSRIETGQWQTAITQLLEAGLIEREGEKRGTKYRAVTIPASTA